MRALEPKFELFDIAYLRKEKLPGADVAFERLRSLKEQLGQLILIVLNCPFWTTQTPHILVRVIREWSG